MHDILTNLKAKLAKQEKQYQDDNQQLSEDYKRITEQYIDLQKKSKYATNPIIYVFWLKLHLCLVVTSKHVGTFCQWNFHRIYTSVK